MYDLIVRDGHVVSHSIDRRVDIAISDGRVEALLEPGYPAEAKRIVEVGGRTVIPGLVDTHVHFRAPGHPERETFGSGSSAAAAGGVTTVLEMPTADVATTTGEEFRDRVAFLRGESVVDFALYGGAGPRYIDQIPVMAALGAVAFKTFMHGAPAGREATLGRIAATGNSEMLSVLTAVGQTGLVSAIHCEDDSLLEHYRGLASSSDGSVDAFSVHERIRPPVVEDMAVARACILGIESGTPIHFVHTSTPGAVAIVDKFRGLGLDASIETCPHYLCLSAEEIREHGIYAKCNPPVRHDAFRRALMAKLATGAIDNVASDHCPYTRDDFERMQHDPINSPAGFAQIQYGFVMLMQRVRLGELSLRELVSSMSRRPAVRFGLTRKGDLQVGFDADFAVVDLDADTVFPASGGFSAGALNVHHLAGLNMAGRVVETYVRGHQVYRDGEIVQQPGFGRWLPGRATSQEVWMQEVSS